MAEILSFKAFPCAADNALAVEVSDSEFTTSAFDSLPSTSPFSTRPWLAESALVVLVESRLSTTGVFAAAPASTRFQPE